MIKEIEHAGLMSRNTRSLAEWYKDTLGFQEVFASDADPQIIFLKLGEGMLLELFPWKDEFSGPSDGSHRQVSHLCLASSDLDGDLKDLTAKGVIIASEVKHLFGGARAVFFLDEEGNYLHLVERPVIPWEK